MEKPLEAFLFMFLFFWFDISVSPNLSDEKPVQRFKYLLLYRRNFIKYLEIFYFVIKANANGVRIVVR